MCYIHMPSWAQMGRCAQRGNASERRRGRDRRTKQGRSRPSRNNKFWPVSSLNPIDGFGSNLDCFICFSMDMFFYAASAIQLIVFVHLFLLTGPEWLTAQGNNGFEINGSVHISILLRAFSRVLYTPSSFMFFLKKKTISTSTLYPFTIFWHFANRPPQRVKIRTLALARILVPIVV